MITPYNPGANSHPNQRLFCVWQFKSVDGRQSVERCRPYMVADKHFQNEYNRIIGTVWGFDAESAHASWHLEVPRCSTRVYSH